MILDLIKNNVYDIWFSRVDVSNSIKLKLYKNFSTDEIFNFSKNDFLEQGLKLNSIDKFLNYNYKKKLESYKQFMDKNGISQIFYDDKRYPEKLKKMLNYPTYIFARRQYRFNV